MTKLQEKLINEMMERFEGTYSISNTDLELIKKKFDFTPKKGCKIFLKNTGTNMENGEMIREVFLGVDGYNVAQHICYI